MGYINFVIKKEDDVAENHFLKIEMSANGNYSGKVLDADKNEIFHTENADVNALVYGLTSFLTRQGTIVSVKKIKSDDITKKYLRKEGELKKERVKKNNKK